MLCCQRYATNRTTLRIDLCKSATIKAFTVRRGPFLLCVCVCVCVCVRACVFACATQWANMLAFMFPSFRCLACRGLVYILDQDYFLFILHPAFPHTNCKLLEFPFMLGLAINILLGKPRQGCAGTNTTQHTTCNVRNDSAVSGGRPWPGTRKMISSGLCSCACVCVCVSSLEIFFVIFSHHLLSRTDGRPVYIT